MPREGHDFRTQQELAAITPRPSRPARAWAWIKGATAKVAHIAVALTRAAIATPRRTYHAITSKAPTPRARVRGTIARMRPEAATRVAIAAGAAAGETLAPITHAPAPPKPSPTPIRPPIGGKLFRELIDTGLKRSAARAAISEAPVTEAPATTSAEIAERIARAKTAAAQRTAYQRSTLMARLGRAEKAALGPGIEWPVAGVGAAAAALAIATEIEAHILAVHEIAMEEFMAAARQQLGPVHATIKGQPLTQEQVDAITDRRIREIAHQEATAAQRRLLTDAARDASR